MHFVFSYTINLMYTYLKNHIKISDVPDPQFWVQLDPDPEFFFQIRIRPDPDPDSFFKLESGRNRIRIFFSN